MRAPFAGVALDGRVSLAEVEEASAVAVAGQGEAVTEAGDVGDVGLDQFGPFPSQGGIEVVLFVGIKRVE